MKYLILGGTGTLGRATITALLRDPQTQSIVALSRDELKQYELKKEFNDERLSCVLGDIRDRSSIEEHFHGIDTCFHFAALKRIPEMEAHPQESLKTNVLGTINAAECAKAARVRYFIFSSTDKACQPINTYGACKFLSEQLVFSYNGKCETLFSVFRWGNVLGSRGSVIHEFKKSLESRSAISITDENMTRFWIRIEDAVKFMLTSYRERSNQPKIPPMAAAPLLSIAAAVADEVGRADFAIERIGLRPGEKIHEDIQARVHGQSLNSKNAKQYSALEIADLVKEVL
jgi:UDP-N-acetylglucosamine 4,6-dehydratase